VLNVRDSGAPGDGIDDLILQGTAAADTFLLRKSFVALVHPDADASYTNTKVERVNYDGSINGRLDVEGNDGDDRFYL
ncbi:hypothetical protein AB2D03_34930, partial [Pseudomonas aeruginosa]